VLRLVAVSAAEYPTWIALPMAWVLLFTGRSHWHWSAGAALLGLSFLSRTDQSAGIAATLAVFLLKNRNRWRLAVAATIPVLVVLGSLPLLHNLYYGHRAELLTASRGAALEVPISAIPRSLWDSNARALIWSHLSWMLDVSVKSSAPLMDSLRVLQVAWLVAVVLVWRRSNAPTWMRALMLLPVAYLGIHLVFQVSVYYPRHVVVGHLAMGMAIAMAAFWWVHSGQQEKPDEIVVLPTGQREAAQASPIPPSSSRRG
jgi:hypothetical protein